MQRTSEATARRLAVLSGHMQGEPELTPVTTLCAEECSGSVATPSENWEKVKASLSASPFFQLKNVPKEEIEAFAHFLEHHNLEDRQKAREFCMKNSEIFVEDWDRRVPLDQQRKETIKKTIKMVSSGLTSVRDLRDNPGRYFGVVETFAAQDLSAVSMATITLNLFGASVLFLGNEKHHSLILDRVDNCDVLGAFAMSELNHGSDVSHCETTATFDASSDEWVIRTPHDGAQKYWIGISLLSANYLVVFARLVTNGADHGVHPFLVPIRDVVGGPLRPGVVVKSTGKKAGLDGIDNGRIFFDNYRIPRWYLLDKIGSVSRTGEYSSPYASENKRFAAIFAGLVVARFGVGSTAARVARAALDMALRYAHSRTQFSIEKAGAEVPLIAYGAHQQRLLSHLSSIVAVTVFANACKDPLLKGKADAFLGSKDLHLDACCLKAYGSWYAVWAVQECREACGGQGYLARNVLMSWRTDLEILQTLDGDNRVLCQQIVKILIEKLGSKMAKKNLVASATEVLSNEFHARIGFFLSFDPEDLPSVCTLFQAREDAVLYALVKELRNGGRGNPMHQFKVWNANIALVERVAKAHAERRIVESFVSGLHRMRGQPHLYGALRNLCILFVLTRVSEDGWFVASGCVKKSKFLDIPSETDALCQKIAPYTHAIIESFRTPDFIFKDTIADDWLRVNSRDANFA
eukprot:ANDGO_04294.mRNA.1 Acyl-coenzyme A oxidase